MDLPHKYLQNKFHHLDKVLKETIQNNDQNHCFRKPYNLNLLLYTLCRQWSRNHYRKLGLLRNYLQNKFVRLDKALEETNQDKGQSHNFRIFCNYLEMYIAWCHLESIR